MQIYCHEVERYLLDKIIGKYKRSNISLSKKGKAYLDRLEVEGEVFVELVPKVTIRYKQK